jgi:hypothetical protein
MNAQEYSKMLEVEAEVNRLSLEISSLIKKREPLQNQLRELQSRHYIETLGIKKGDCETPNGHGEWFGTVWSFAEWLKSHSEKPWAIWNGRIYRSSDLMAGRMPESPALESSLS